MTEVPETPIMWTGDPICYKRQGGSSLIAGKYHYLFDEFGAIISAQPVTRPILASVLQHLYKDKALAMAAWVKPVPAPKEFTEEDVRIRINEETKGLQQNTRAKQPPDLGGRL